jgi:FixJ family two-component response regulator
MFALDGDGAFLPSCDSFMTPLDRHAAFPAWPGAARLHLIWSDPETREAAGPALQARFGGFSSHVSSGAFHASVPREDWGAALICLSEGEGADSGARLRQTHPGVRIVMAAERPSVKTVIDAMHAGVSDFFELPVPAAPLVDALALALEGARRSHAARLEREDADRRLRGLTRREQDVLDLLLTGETSKQIARRLDLSHRTVEYFRARVFAKTGADSLADLARLHAAAHPVLSRHAGSAAIT